MRVVYHRPRKPHVAKKGLFTTDDLSGHTYRNMPPEHPSPRIKESTWAIGNIPETAQTIKERILRLEEQLKAADLDIQDIEFFSYAMNPETKKQEVVPGIAALEYDLKKAQKNKDTEWTHELLARLQIQNICLKEAAEHYALLVKKRDILRKKLLDQEAQSPSRTSGIFKKSNTSPSTEEPQHRERISNFGGKQIAEAIKRRLPTLGRGVIQEMTQISEDAFAESLQDYAEDPEGMLDELEPYTSVFLLKRSDVQTLYERILSERKAHALRKAA